MKNCFYPFVIVCLLIKVSSAAQELPLGYIIQYNQDFSKKSALNDFNVSCPGSWQVTGENKNYFLEFSGQSTYTPSVRSPKNIGVLSKYMFGDFILEADFQPAGPGNDQLDLCIFFGLRDSLHFYYVHLLSNPVDSQNIFIVNNADKTGIATKTDAGIKLSGNKWHKLRVERNIVTKTITVFVNNMSNPLMTAKDKTLIMGYTAFGSFEGCGRIDNINIYAPTAIPVETDIFTSQ